MYLTSESIRHNNNTIMFTSIYYKRPVTEMNFTSNDDVSRPKIPAEITIIGRIDLNYELEPADMEYELLEPIDMDLETIYMDYDLETVLDYEMEDLVTCCKVEIINTNETLEPKKAVDIEFELEFICMGIAFMHIEDEEIEIDWEDLWKDCEISTIKPNFGK